MTFILIAITLMLGPDDGQEHDYSRLRKAGLAAYQNGNYFEAETLIQKAIRFASLHNDEYALALSYSALADIYHAESRIPAADRTYQRALSILRRRPAWSHATAIVSRNFAVALTTEARYDEALTVLNEASKLLSKNKVNDPQLSLLLLNSLAVIRFRQGKMTKAQTLLVRATQIKGDATNPQDANLWEVWNNLGRVYQDTRQYEKAENAYARSLQLAEADLQPSDPNFAVVVSNLGSLCAETRRYEMAKDHFRRALAILEETKMPFDESTLMHTLHALAKIYILQNDQVRAHALLAQAMEIARRISSREDMPEVAELLETYSKALRDINSSEAQRLNDQAKRIRASLAFTVPATSVK
jgi:tetratricopeptide (TPR) repeat protein